MQPSQQKSSNFLDIPTNVAIRVSKYSRLADGPRYAAFHNPTRKGY